MFDFPERLVQCDKCGHRTTAKYVDRVCALPQPDGTSCTGTLRLSAKPKAEDETVLITIGGVLIGQIKLPKVDPFPAPKVRLSDRAKEAAAAAYDDCDKGPRKSMQYAVEAAANIIAADNIEMMRREISVLIPLLDWLHDQTGTIKPMLDAVVRMLGDVVEAFDPNRPSNTEESR